MGAVQVDHCDQGGGGVNISPGSHRHLVHHSPDRRPVRSSTCRGRPEPTLSKGIKWNGQYAQWFNRKYKRSGHLFSRALLRLTRREGELPVDRDALRRPQSGPGSYGRPAGGLPARAATARWPATKRHLLGWPRTGRCSNSVPICHPAEQQPTFVDEGAAIVRSPFEAVVGQIFLGTASWIESMQAPIDSGPRRTEHPAAQRFAGRPSVNKMIEVVARVFMDNPREIRQRHGGPERRLGLLARMLRRDESVRRNRGVRCDRWTAAKKQQASVGRGSPRVPGGVRGHP